MDSFLGGLEGESFDVLLLLGVAGGRDHLTPELFGRNFVGRTPDIIGEIRFGPIDLTGPALLPCTLWDPALLSEWTLNQAVRTSFDAGTYLCNYITYKALARFPDKRVGFLHVPSEEKLPLERQAETLRQILESLAR